MSLSYGYVRFIKTVLPAALFFFMLSEFAIAQTTESVQTTVASTTQSTNDTSSTAAPKKPIAEVGTKTVENPYGIEALWSQGDFVARGTLLIMLLMSGATWYVLVTKWLSQRQLARWGRTATLGEGSLSDRIAKLPPCPYHDLLSSAEMATKQAKTAHRLDPDSWIATAIDDAVDRVNGYLQSGMSVLATVGSTAPFVGLFGTVWGIYHALTAIGVSGQASIDKVAGPVGEALIMTAIGLAVAVPAVLCYNWLLRRNRVIMDQVRLHGDNLHAESVMSVVG